MRRTASTGTVVVVGDVIGMWELAVGIWELLIGIFLCYRSI
jgi:hypothetical protein